MKLCLFPDCTRPALPPGSYCGHNHAAQDWARRNPEKHRAALQRLAEKRKQLRAEKHAEKPRDWRARILARVGLDHRYR